MNNLLKVAALLACFVAAGITQTINNVEFTDLNGVSYDLHTLLENGKHVLVHASGSR